MSTLKVDLDLVQKYNVAGPRYTSYPPATKFTNDAGWDQLAGQIGGQQPQPRDLSFTFTFLLRNALLVLRLHHGHHLNHDKGRAYMWIIWGAKSPGWPRC
jgi:hypothetical protein